MNRHDLNLAFYRRLIAYTVDNMSTKRPDEVFDPKDESNIQAIRRGAIMLNAPMTFAIGNGVSSRMEGIYQIDIWVPRNSENAFKIASDLSDGHLAHFFPANGRGLTLTENQTSAHITRRPTQSHLGREGAYLRDIVEVNFFVEVYAL